jgi:hypothetical protein
MAGHLQIRRESGHYRDRTRADNLFVDGEHAGKVRQGETASVEVAAGAHTVELRVDWGRSEALQTDVADDQAVRLRCHPDTSQVALVAITIGRKRYIVLEPTPARTPGCRLLSKRELRIHT